MTVHLPPRIERIVSDAVLSGQCRSPEEVVSEAITVWQAQQTGAVQPATDERQAAIERLKSFGKAHQLSLGSMTIKQLRDEARASQGQGVLASGGVLSSSRPMEEVRR